MVIYFIWEGVYINSCLYLLIFLCIGIFQETVQIRLNYFDKNLSLNQANQNCILRKHFHNIWTWRVISLKSGCFQGLFGDLIFCQFIENFYIKPSGFKECNKNVKQWTQLIYNELPDKKICKVICVSVVEFSAYCCYCLVAVIMMVVVVLVVML